MRVAIVGLGLIGGSLARALTARGHQVIGVDDARARRRAKAAGAISQGIAAVEDAAGDADVVVLAAPPRANLKLLRRLARAPGDEPVVTDVGSVKTPIDREARRLGLSRFVGGHPIAGSEGSGFGASSETLFRGRAWVLTASADADALRLVRRLVRATGAKPFLLEAMEHDRTLAFLSHVPQIVSWALFEAAAGDPVARRSLGLAGPGFRDMTRLAKSPRPLWRDILGQNKTEVARALRVLEGALARSRRSLRS
jgi:prephenate dehydrogenase